MTRLVWGKVVCRCGWCSTDIPMPNVPADRWWEDLTIIRDNGIPYCCETHKNLSLEWQAAKKKFDMLELCRQQAVQEEDRCR